MKRRRLKWYRLSFPRELDEATVLAVLSSLSGVPHGTRLLLDVVASEAGIEHNLGVTPVAADIVAAELRAAGAFASTR
jgi:hypothetical protein